MLVSFFRNGLTAVLGIALAALASGVGGSPFPSVDTAADAHSLLSRGSNHTGAYVGTPCSTATDCYSQRCAYNYTIGDLTCQRQTAGFPCFENNNCGSRQCSNGSCAASLVGGKCDDIWDCTDGQGATNETVGCTNHRCLTLRGLPCTSDAFCETGRCSSDKLCGIPPQVPNGQCQRDGECLSNSCSDVRTCYNADGSLYACYNDRCDGYPLGHRCSNKGECAQGFCTNGICKAGKAGVSCFTDSQCGGSLLCDDDIKKCTTVAEHSRHPQEGCSSDSQCLSGRCVTNLPITDKYDIPVTYPNSDFGAVLHCDYFRLGEGPARNFVDCGVGVPSANRTCVLGSDGATCTYSSQCVNVCGPNGKCYAPKTKLGNAAACTKDLQCYANHCYPGTLVTRTNPYNSSLTIQVVDSVCYYSSPGDACGVDDDCYQSACRNGVCVTLPLGASCSSDQNCNPPRCADAGDGKGSVCSLYNVGDICDDPSECHSNQCRPDCDPDTCYVVYNYCQPATTLGLCNKDNPCAANNTCDKDGKCRLVTGQKCKKSTECLSRACDSATGKCVAAASTISKTSSTISKAGSTSTSSKSTATASSTKRKSTSKTITSSKPSMTKTSTSTRVATATTTTSKSA